MEKCRSFRLVCGPAQISLVEALLAGEGFAFTDEPFSRFCKRFTRMPLAAGASLAAFFGYIYIQDRSAMLPPLALAPRPGAAILDMCASPGGKSSFLAQLAGESGFVLANEPNAARLATLRANLERSNLLNVCTSAYPGERLPPAPASWEYILLDPPCSGWGTAQKHPKTLKMWQGEKTRPLIALQRRLLERAAELLAPGGLLLYSTCTTNPAENEEQIEYASGVLGLEARPVPQFPGFVCERKAAGAILVNGAASDAQGFYLALLKKPGLYAQAPPQEPREFQLLDAALLRGPVFEPALLPPGDCALFGNQVRFLPELAARLPVRLAWRAPLLGSFGKSFIPAARLRQTLPRQPGSALILEEISQIRELLAGKGMATHLPGPHVALWWRELPLGVVGVKSGRVISPFR